ncbi:MAG TPA: SET domain-containing protein-lysine N-methyltransferase, partial [Burkholderiaceae bacterium]|nr:SET domain-containing protein-lysine N-methyltransferase [Burkholderiaceae bacterium]
RESVLGFGANAYTMQYKEPGSTEPLYVVDARTRGSLGRFINHVCGASANCEIEGLQYHNFRVMTFRASKDIEPGSVIRFNYFGADSHITGTSDNQCRERTLSYWKGCRCGDHRCVSQAAGAGAPAIPPPLPPPAPPATPDVMPAALRTLAPGHLIFKDGPHEIRLSEQRRCGRQERQIGLRALTDGLPLPSTILHALQALLARRYGVGFAHAPAVGPNQCWLAPYQFVSPTSPPFPVGLDGIQSCAADVQVLVPVNLNNAHWILLEASPTHGSIVVYDSARHAADRYQALIELALQQIRALAKRLRRFDGEWRTQFAPCPQQPPLSNDCMIHLVANMHDRVHQITRQEARRPYDRPQAITTALRIG